MQSLRVLFNSTIIDICFVIIFQTVSSGRVKSQGLEKESRVPELPLDKDSEAESTDKGSEAESTELEGRGSGGKASLCWLMA